MQCAGVEEDSRIKGNTLKIEDQTKLWKQQTGDQNKEENTQESNQSMRCRGYRESTGSTLYAIAGEFLLHLWLLVYYNNLCLLRFRSLTLICKPSQVLHRDDCSWTHNWNKLPINYVFVRSKNTQQGYAECMRRWCCDAWKRYFIPSSCRYQIGCMISHYLVAEDLALQQQ